PIYSENVHGLSWGRSAMNFLISSRRSAKTMARLSGTTLSAAATASSNKRSAGDVSTPEDRCSTAGPSSECIRIIVLVAQLAVTVWNTAGGLWFASAWTGTNTAEQLLGGGAVQIH